MTGKLPSLDDAWILQQRGPRNVVDPHRPYSYTVEPERSFEGRVEEVATIFLTNRECPFRCLMCDLWRNTTPERVPDGAVVEQIEWALQRLPPAQHLKLYNAGNFFDEQAIAQGDRQRMPYLLSPFRSVIVESHPKLVDRRSVEFARSINPQLEVAMGLETVDPQVLARLNKRMTLDDFSKATAYLLMHGVTVRAFILLRTPFQSDPEGIEWAIRSIEFAFSIGVQCCAVIPTRVGNGAMEWLHQHGYFHMPSMHAIEKTLEAGVQLGGGRVFMDLWNIEKFYDCNRCGPQRSKRIARINLTQKITPPISCHHCGAR